MVMELDEFAQQVGIPLESDLDRRVLAWLRAAVGDEAIRDAVARIPGRRRPYVSNLCKALGVAVPPEVVDPSRAALAREEARARLMALRRQLGI